MQVPEHVISLYVATCGQNGVGLGSDEKEIILLVYVILEASTGQIVGTKQVLVRPDGSFVKDRTISVSSDTSNTAASPPLAITYSESNCNTNNNNNNNNNATIITNNNNNNSPTSASTNNNNNNNTTLNGPSTPTDNIIELPIAVAQAAGKPLIEAIEEFDEYLRSLSLNDILGGSGGGSSTASLDFKLITDGQLPLRQCLQREACAKDIELPSYYNRFCDLRKEFLHYKSGDLSRALVPLKDIKKMMQLPLTPPPQSIGEMLKELNIASTEDAEFYVRESRDMVSVIQTLLKGGHKFAATECVNLVLEPGICSIDDEIDGNCIVRARGLPWQSSDQDIAKFFRGLNVAKGGVALCLSPLGRRNGEALIRFVSQEHRDMALKRHKHHIGNRYIEVYRATGEDFLAIAGGASNEAQAFLSKGAQVIIRMRGLPYDCTAKQVLDFFTNGENPCSVLDTTEGVLFVKKPDGRATGDAFVLFANEADAPKALSRHRESIGQRYIELFRSTTAEVQQVLNRSMDPKTYESNHQPPLIAQLPTVQLSLLPQHLITSGTTKNCIRLRGLPYEALVEHILHFLDDFAKHIIYQGVHMVINAQGQPSGEAFIQMDSEDTARLCAQRKHNQFMVFGKKYRYIEVFQCSGDDMNMVLNGGLQSPVAAAHHHHAAAAAAAAAHHAAAAVAASGGKQPSLLSPGASVIGAPFGPFTHHFGPPTPLLASPHHPHPHHPHHRSPHHPHPHAHTHPGAHHPAAAAAAAFYPHPLVYWPYPSPPVSPTTYYSQPPHTPTPHGGLAAQHQALYSLDFLPAVPQPANYSAAHHTAAAPALSAQPPPPPQQQQQGAPTTAALILAAPQKSPQTLTLVQPKQFPPLTASVAPTFHNNNSNNNKIALQQAAPPPQQQQQQPQTNNIYHYAPPPANVADGVASTHPPQALLTIDTTHSGVTKPPNAAPAAPKVTNVSTYAAISAGGAAAAASSAVVVSGNAQVAAAALVPPNQCVELYIS